MSGTLVVAGCSKHGTCMVEGPPSPLPPDFLPEPVVAGASTTHGSARRREPLSDGVAVLDQLLGGSTSPLAAHPRRPESVLDHLVYAIDDAGDVAEQLKEKRPQHFDAGTLLDEHGEEGQDQAQQDEQDFDQGILPWRGIRLSSLGAQEQCVRVSGRPRPLGGLDPPMGRSGGFSPR